MFGSVVLSEEGFAELVSADHYGTGRRHLHQPRNDPREESFETVLTVYFGQHITGCARARRLADDLHFAQLYLSMGFHHIERKSDHSGGRARHRSTDEADRESWFRASHQFLL